MELLGPMNGGIAAVYCAEKYEDIFSEAPKNTEWISLKKSQPSKCYQWGKATPSWEIPVPGSTLRNHVCRPPRQCLSTPTYLGGMEKWGSLPWARGSGGNVWAPWLWFCGQVGFLRWFIVESPSRWAHPGNSPLPYSHLLPWVPGSPEKGAVFLFPPYVCFVHLMSPGLDMWKDSICMLSEWVGVWMMQTAHHTAGSRWKMGLGKGRI